MRQGSNLVNDARAFWYRWGWIERLIAINIIVFTALWMSSMPSTGWGFLKWMALPLDPIQWLGKPWTLLTYSVSQKDFWHLLWNILLFYWAAQFLVGFLGQRVILMFYGGGAFAGALLFWLGTGLPLWWTMGGFEKYQTGSPLFGASAAVMAFFWASVLLAPDFEIRLFGILPIRLRWLGLAMALYVVAGLFFANSGGHWAHLGGALWGWGYLRYLQGQRWLPQWGSGAGRKIPSRDPKDPIFIQAETDRLLDKISKSGFASLKSSEKLWLDQYHRP